MTLAGSISVLGLASATYGEKLCAAALQGLANRDGPVVFMDYGVYDAPEARRTNEIFIDDEAWFTKFRSMVGNQDLLNLDYYRKEHGFAIRQLANLDEFIAENLGILNGYVIWDEAVPDSVNIALMLCARDSLLPVSPEMSAGMDRFGLTLRHDLRGRWPDRLALYRWAFSELWSSCAVGVVACVEPGWHRPEFVDYIVQNRIFTYSLAGGVQGLGSTLLMLLAFGPAFLRELVFGLRLDGVVRRLGLGLMALKSEEVRFLAGIPSATTNWLSCSSYRPTDCVSYHRTWPEISRFTQRSSRSVTRPKSQVRNLYSTPKELTSHSRSPMATS